MTLLIVSLTFVDPSVAEFTGNSVQCIARPGYVKPVTTYCTLAEYELAKPHFFVGAIEKLVAGEPVQVLRMSLFSLSDLSMANRICNTLSASTKEVTVSVQKDTSSEVAVNHLVNCAKQRGIPVAKGYFSGMEVGGINSFHPKLVYVETPMRRLAWVGSGNISGGRKHLDYVYSVETSKVGGAADANAKPLVDWTDCVTQRLNNDAFDNRRDTVLKIRFECKAVDTREAHYLMPGDARPLLARMGYLLGQASELRVISQGFNSADINFLVRLALRERKKVKILLDDDMFWAHLYPAKELMNEPYEYLEHVLPLIQLGAEVRYVVTDHHHASRNFQHAKAYSFHAVGGGGQALVGSMNATASGLSDNLEVVTEIEGTGFKQYLAWFDNLWERAIPHVNMPQADPLVP
ncbi:MAG: hypothetical protein JWR74_827 [Polaromonas sp.]|nr:hypothetical protein [Polaromonas sp.]